MKNRDLRLAALGTIGAVLILSQQACASDVAAQPTTAPAASASTTTGPTSAASTTTASSRAPASPCSNDDVTVDVTFQPQMVKGDNRSALVALTNKSSSTCQVEGRASISLVNAADEVVDVPTKEVDQPGAATAISLRPGRTAFEGIKWTTCDKGSDTCGAGNTLRFNLQASTDGPVAKLIGFPAAEKSDITMASLQVGTLQPSNQGVVAW